MELPPLRPFQRQALDILECNPQVHLIATAATGSGKSRIFEELARKSNTPPQSLTQTLIISPLQALVRQQRERLTTLGVDVVDRFDSHGSLPQALVMTPESLARRIDRGMLIPKTALFVVDECHCIDQWGGSFRPEFALVPALVSRFKIQRSLWLSATLSAEARARLRRQLPEPQQELGEFTLQKNLRIQRVKVPWNERAEFLKRWLDHSQHAGIVFASTRGACIDLARLMASWTPTPESVTAYHAGLVPEERQAAEDGIRSGRIRWVVATSAFGMGMNFPSLRWVILWQVPYSVLDLAQMLGRAGRTANEPATAFALWDDADFFWLSKHLQTSQLQELRELYETTEGLDRRLEAHFSERPLEHSVET